MASDQSAPQAKPAVPPSAEPFATVLAAEQNAIHDLRVRRGVAPDQKLFGLTFSGGGIRSATLCLGMLQAFANRGLLKHVDYLSTVSGGGYIGSWLTAWIHRRGLRQVTASLDPEPPPAKPGEAPPDPQPLSWLRQFSNYLTPKASAFSADTWSMAAIWSRNTLLNLLILVTAIASLLLLPRMAGRALQSLVHAGDDPEWPYLLCTGAPLLLATVLTGVNLFTFASKKNSGWLGCQFAIQCLIVLPTFLAGMAVSVWLAVHVETFSSSGFLAGIRRPAFAFFVLYAVILLTGDFARCFNAQHQRIRQPFRFLADLLLELMIAAVSAFLTAALFRALANLVETWPEDQRAWTALTFGPPLVLLVFALGVIIQIGLMGADLPDPAREWLGRLRAWMTIYSVAWLAFGLTSIYGPLWIAAVGAWWGKTGIGLGAGWILSTISGVLAGKSDKSGSDGSSDKSTAAAALDLIAGAAPYLFMAGFLLAISFGVHMLTTHLDAACTLSASAAHASEQAAPSNLFLADLQADYWHQMNNQTLWASVPDNCIWSAGVLVNLFGICAAACLLFAWRVDINEFSLHHFYRNRLVRAYLGATTCHRQPNPFTGFDDRDDIKLARVLDAPQHSCGGADPDFQYDGPYPILNATLNISVGRNLAWQEREGTSFIFTPLYTGFDTGYERVEHRAKPGLAGRIHGLMNRGARVDELNPEEDPGVSPEAVGDAPGHGLAACGYEPTAAFGSVGPSLGTAMAISGAAANPNHGYHTSTVVAFLLTVFDVRLGWWMANPRRPAMLRFVGPVFGFGYLLKELLGLTDARTKFVNLSDGGHFDNMGLYELIRRRCRYIVVCDGEQDQNLTFGGLAGAIRKCRIDFDTEIYIDLDKIRKKRGNDGPAEFSQAHFAVGTIRYPEDRENPGTLVYLKASLTGDEPVDVLEYHSREPLFPHQSTADQWFDESQFESYRRLGLHIGSEALHDRDTGDLGTLFAGLAHK